MELPSEYDLASVSSIARAIDSRVLGLQSCECAAECGDVFLCVRGADLNAQARVTFGHHRKTEPDYEHSEVEQPLGHRNCLRGVMHDHWANRGIAFKHGKTSLSHTFARGGDIVAQSLHAFGFAHEDFDCLVRTARDRAGKRVGKERRPTALRQEIDRARAPDDVSTRATTERFAERAGEVINRRRWHAEVFVRTATSRAHHAGAVGVIDDEQRVELIAQRAHRREICDVAFHRENTIGHDPNRAGDFGILARVFEFHAQRGNIVVLVDRAKEPLLYHARESNAIDDRRVIEFIRDNEIARFAKCCKDRFVRIPTTREGVSSLATIERTQTRFERRVAIEVAADETHARRPRAVLAKTSDASFDDLRMIRKTEIVVRTEAQHFATVRKKNRAVHRALNRLQSLQLPVVRERVENVLRA